MPDISCEAEDLISEARCLDSCLPRGIQTAVLISIFCRMANTSCDAEDLIEDAKCLFCKIPTGMEMPVLISLACQIVNNGGGGGGGGDPQVFSGHYGGLTPATPIPAATVTSAVNYDLDFPFPMWKWDSVALAWTA